MHQWIDPSPVAEPMAPEVRRPRARDTLPRSLAPGGHQGPSIYPVPSFPGPGLLQGEMRPVPLRF
jgi:hypothetical protein